MADFKNERPAAVPEGFRNPLILPRNVPPGKLKFVDTSVSKGMITTVDPADIPGEAVQLARNTRFRFDYCVPRFGTSLLQPLGNFDHPATGVGYFQKNDGTEYVFRIDSTSLSLRTTGSWIDWPAFGGASYPAGTAKVKWVAAFNRFFFAPTDGSVPIQEVDITNTRFIPLGDAPQYKYYTSFYNRLIGANLVSPHGGGEPDPTNIGWSADAGITGIGLEEWDASVDETAGNTPLVDSPRDLSDAITGLVAVTNALIILRQHSIWVATKLPIPTQPFNFYCAVPGLGCDCPGSVAITNDPTVHNVYGQPMGNGIAWLDTNTGTVWSYTPGAAPQAIGRPIEDRILAGITDKEAVFASFDPRQQEYSLCVPRVGTTIVTMWTYNFRTQTWSYDEYGTQITAINDINLPFGIITIEELLGTIEGLTGTIEELSPTDSGVPTRVFSLGGQGIVGIHVNQLAFEDSTKLGDDYQPPGVPLITTLPFQAELISKSFTVPTDDIYVAEFRLEYLPLSLCPITLFFSRDGGVTWDATTKTVTPTVDMIGKPQIIKWMRQVKCRRYAWRYLAGDAVDFTKSGQFRILGYEVHIYEGGESSQ